MTYFEDQKSARCIAELQEQLVTAKLERDGALALLREATELHFCPWCRSAHWEAKTHTSDCPAMALLSGVAEGG